MNWSKCFIGVLFFSLCLTACKKEGQEVDLDQSTYLCPNPEMVYQNGDCRCPSGTIKIGDDCQTLDSNYYWAELSNTPYPCFDTAWLYFPSLFVSEQWQYPLALYFSPYQQNRNMSASIDCRYASNSTFEIATDNAFGVFNPYEITICDDAPSRGYITVLKPIGSNQAEASFDFFNYSTLENDTFTIIFHQYK